jgi:hypothetical protein
MPLINPWTIYLGSKAVLFVGGYAAKKHLARKARKLAEEEKRMETAPVQPVQPSPSKKGKDTPTSGPVLIEVEDDDKT